MPPPNPVANLKAAPFAEVIRLLLGQFRRLLAERDLTLTPAEITTIAAQLAGGGEVDDAMKTLRDRMIAIVAESEAVLAGWHLSFAESLKTGMEAMPGWETTAEFLEIANTKSNAELRISAGAALVTALGDGRYAPYLLDLIEHDPDEEDVDAVIARRVLLFASGVDDQAGNWREQVRVWVEDGP
jgi:hypothetical protein